MNEVNNYFQDECELDEVEQTFRSLIIKLSSTESKLKEIQMVHQEAILSKLELENLLDSERRDLTNERAQLKLMQLTLQEWEQERCAIRESSLKQGIQLESITNEKNSMFENVKVLQNENVALKLKLETNEKEVMIQKNLRSILQTHRVSMNSKFENIFTQSRKLEAEQNVLQKNVGISVNLCRSMIQLLKLHHKKLNESLIENDRLRQNENFLLNEMKLLKENNCKDGKNLRNNYDEENCNIIENFKNYESLVLTVSDRINRDAEDRVKLEDLLKKTLDEQITFLEHEQILKDRITQLEKLLTLPNEKNEKCNCTRDTGIQTRVEATME